MLPDRSQTAFPLVIPVFNEDKVLPELFAWLGALFDANTGLRWHAVLVNDSSRDSSTKIIRPHAQCGIRRPC